MSAKLAETFLEMQEHYGNIKESILERSLTNANSVLRILGERNICENMRVHTRESERSSTQSKMHYRRKPGHKGTKSSNDENPATLNSTTPQSGHAERHVCWICQDEMSSDAALLAHYDNHMRVI